METLCLVPHPEHTALQVTAIGVSILAPTPHWLRVRWRIEGAGRVVLPGLAGKGRTHGLWQRTCFEVFLSVPGEAGYVELNLSPSEQWAAYDFTGYREGMAERAMPRDPVCTARGSGELLIFDAAVPLAGLPQAPWQVGLTAVIEEEGGMKSYWALAHPPGKPDFHSPACFAATVAAPRLP